MVLPAVANFYRPAPKKEAKAQNRQRSLTLPMAVLCFFATFSVALPTHPLAGAATVCRFGLSFPSVDSILLTLFCRLDSVDSILSTRFCRLDFVDSLKFLRCAVRSSSAKLSQCRCRTPDPTANPQNFFAKYAALSCAYFTKKFSRFN